VRCWSATGVERSHSRLQFLIGLCGCSACVAGILVEVVPFLITIRRYFYPEGVGVWYAWRTRTAKFKVFNQIKLHLVNHTDCTRISFGIS
jgi:hypothetical protein